MAARKRPPPRNVAAEPITTPAAPPAPHHVAILGMGPSLDQYTLAARQSGGRNAYCDEVWVVNALGAVMQCDRIFHMDDVRIQEIRAAARPKSNIARMLDWMRVHPGPIYTSRTHPDYPGLVEFPLQDLLNAIPYPYLNNTAAYAVAYACLIGVKKLSIFGCDYTYPNATDAEKGRGCLEFWLGIAASRGITLNLPHATSLMDRCVPARERLYGHDTRDVAITAADGRVTVTFTERAGPLPTADEIEAAYDHSAHPNPLVPS